MEQRGIFITFEGGEGSGKTTQINRLAASLTQAGYKVITTREPGGTPEGERIRDLIVQRDGGEWTAKAEALLLFAAREMLCRNVIMPALAKGKIVICDRFTDSTRAYQGYGRGLDMAVIETLQKTIIDGLEPDMTFVLDIPVVQGLQRSKHRLSGENISALQTEDRFEQMDVDFHERLRSGFLDIAKNNVQRCRIVDALRDINTVSQEIEHIALQKISDKNQA